METNSSKYKNIGKLGSLAKKRGGIPTHIQLWAESLHMTLKENFHSNSHQTLILKSLPIDNLFLQTKLVILILSLKKVHVCCNNFNIVVQNQEN